MKEVVIGMNDRFADLARIERVEASGPQLLVTLMWFYPGLTPTTQFEFRIDVPVVEEFCNALRTVATRGDGDA